MPDALRGLPLGEFARAFRAGSKAYYRSSRTADRRDGQDKIDVEWDRYCRQSGVSYTSPRGNAWMDGWVNADSSVSEFLKMKEEEANGI